MKYNCCGDFFWTYQPQLTGVLGKCGPGYIRRERPCAGVYPSFIYSWSTFENIWAKLDFVYFICIVCTKKCINIKVKKISILPLMYIFVVQNRLIFRVFLCEYKRESSTINQLHIKLEGISYIIYKWNCYITNDLMGCNGPASKEYHDVPTYLCCTYQMHYQRPIVEFPGSKSWWESISDMKIGSCWLEQHYNPDFEDSSTYIIQPYLASGLINVPIKNLDNSVDRFVWLSLYGLILDT